VLYVTVLKSLNLVQADSTISKLMEERSISSQHRQSLQHELVRMLVRKHSCFFLLQSKQFHNNEACILMMMQAELRTKKIVKEVHNGFPLLYVCVVAFIAYVIGHFLRT